jgi:ribosome biogenesis GTPase
MAQKKLTQQQSSRIAQRELSLIDQFNNAGLPGHQKGLVTGSYGHDVTVENELGETVLCKTYRDRTRPVCGDHVLWLSEENNQGAVEAVFPRTSLLERPDSRGNMRTVAANIDRIVIIVAAKPSLNEGLLDRYLVAASIINVTPVIIFNKVDLLDEAGLAEVRRRLDVYQKLGYDIIETSTKQQHGLDILLNNLSGHTAILVGQSGVGKSSLVNKLLPGSNADTNNISDATGKGKHTTTSAGLYHIPGGSGHLIDSPGIREFGLLHARAEDIQHAYHEIDNAASQCKFNDCRHTNEPGCAVQAAIKEGDIDAGRFQRYQRILETIDE